MNQEAEDREGHLLLSVGIHACNQLPALVICPPHSIGMFSHVTPRPNVNQEEEEEEEEANT